MAWRDHLPLETQGWLSEAEDGVGMMLARLGDHLVRAGVKISDRANERWERIQPQIQAAVRELGVCAACGQRHTDDG